MVPALPVRNGDEGRLFQAILASHGGNQKAPYFDGMLDEWKRHVDGQTIFPKHRSHLQLYYRRWTVTFQKKTLRAANETTVSDMRAFLSSNAEAMQFEFFG